MKTTWILCGTYGVQKIHHCLAERLKHLSVHIVQMQEIGNNQRIRIILSVSKKMFG